MLITALKVPIMLVPSEKEQENMEKRDGWKIWPFTCHRDVFLLKKNCEVGEAYLQNFSAVLSLLILFSSQCFISYMFFGTTA